MPLDITDLTSDEAEEQIRTLLNQHTKASLDVEVYQRKVAAIRKMIEAVVELYPEHEDLLPEDLDGGDHPRPRGAEAVRRVLEGQAGKYYPVSAIVALLGQQGWVPESANPANAVRTAAERLVDREVIEKAKAADGTVLYRFPGYDPAEEPF